MKTKASPFANPTGRPWRGSRRGSRSWRWNVELRREFERMIFWGRPRT